MKIQTNEPIEIEVNETNCGMVVITLDGIDYAHFNNATIEDIDIESLRCWIESTYYDNSYKSSAYMSCQLNPNEFQEENPNI